jgi:hypothetical protein
MNINHITQILKTSLLSLMCCLTLQASQPAAQKQPHDKVNEQKAYFIIRFEEAEEKQTRMAEALKTALIPVLNPAVQREYLPILIGCPNGTTRGQSYIYSLEFAIGLENYKQFIKPGIDIDIPIQPQNKSEIKQIEIRLFESKAQITIKPYHRYIIRPKSKNMQVDNATYSAAPQDTARNFCIEEEDYQAILNKYKAPIQAAIKIPQEIALLIARYI